MICMNKLFMRLLNKIAHNTPMANSNESWQELQAYLGFSFMNNKLIH